MEQVITASGHPNVTATHQSTLEVTSDDYLTKAGDCIVAIEADVVPAEFDESFIAACRDDTAEITASIEIGGHRELIRGRGDPALTFESDRAMVIRTSEYVDDRTVLVEADGAASTLDRGLVSASARGGDVTVTLSVNPPLFTQ